MIYVYFTREEGEETNGKSIPKMQKILKLEKKMKKKQKIMKQKKG